MAFGAERTRLYIAVAGTWGERSARNFALPNSAFSMNLETLGYVPASELQPFEWSTEIDGLCGKHAVWRFAGLSLFYYVAPPLYPEARIPGDQTLVIAFSHGAQVALYAFAAGLKGRLVTVNPPIRTDMEATIAQARPNILRWINLYGDWRDLWAALGALRDGHLGIRRKMPQADDNILVPGPHGAALTPRYNGAWADWLDRVWESSHAA